MDSTAFAPLVSFLLRLPAVRAPAGGKSIGRSVQGGTWAVTFRLDIRHPLAWHTVQELSCVLNFLSIEDRLPTRFTPVSPAPYLNGGPEDFLSWVIEAPVEAIDPATCTLWLEARLPRPIDDEAAWLDDDDA